MKKKIIYHGSNHIINKPQYAFGKESNDYGRGFYCTEDIELAKEWACKYNEDGFLNVYTLDVSDLKILDLNQYGVLTWIAILLKFRIFSLENEYSQMAKNYIIDNYYVDVTKYDVVIGYRADDSYFSYAESFVSNGLPINSLKEALMLGELGQQIVLVSKKSFEHLSFIESSKVSKNVYYSKFFNRDINAREKYKKKIDNNDLFIMDIIRQGIKDDDPRIR